MDTSGMQPMDRGAMDMPAMPAMDHLHMDMSAMPAMDHSHMDMSAMPAMDHSNMDMAGMDDTQHHTATPAEAPAGEGRSGMTHMHHAGMDMSGMDHGTTAGDGAAPQADLPADATPRTPLPAITDADRAAAFPAVSGTHATHDRMNHSLVRVERLEVNDDGGGGWDATAWYGGDINRAWLRTEGETAHGRVDHGSVELLYGHAISAWWDLLAGVRLDAGEGPDRAFAAFGVQGVAPYKFEVRATGYLGRSRTAARLEATYDTLLTNRLILQWRSEANLYGGRADPARRLGTGLSTVAAGTRLRYEITRRFAPYVGVEAERAFGGTATLRRASGAPANDTRAVAGIRFWF